MSAWEVEIFDEDLALEVREVFEEALEEGQSISVATRRVLEDFAEELEDFDDGASIYLALAALQLEQGKVLPKIKDQALRIIATGEGMDKWEYFGEEVVRERQYALNQLADCLRVA